MVARSKYRTAEKLVFDGIIFIQKAEDRLSNFFKKFGQLENFDCCHHNKPYTMLSSARNGLKRALSAVPQKIEVQRLTLGYMMIIEVRIF